MSSEFWLDNPTILLDKTQITEIWLTKDMSTSGKYNAITRLVIILSVLGFLVTQNYNFFLTGFITLGVTAILFYARENNSSTSDDKTQKEGFTNSALYQSTKNQFTNPSVKNPFMNVLLPEIQDNPKRKKAAPAYNRAVEKQINNDTQDMIVSNFDNDPEIKKKLFSTLGDSLEFEDFGQYNFYATANTRVPNDQKDFAEFCYGNMSSCKEGDTIQCSKNNRRLGNSMY